MAVTLAQVGAVLRARTRSDETGGEIGTFDTTTRPTADQVNGYIADAVVDVGIAFPQEIPIELAAGIDRLTAIRAAMFVELSYDPDRTGDGTAYDRLNNLFTAGSAAMTQALEFNGTNVVGQKRLVSAMLVSPYSGDREPGKPGEPPEDYWYDAMAEYGNW